MSSGFWVRVAELKTLGRAHLADVADGLAADAAELAAMGIPGDVFGVPGEGPAMVAGYHEVLDQLTRAINETGTQVDRASATITKIAENYQAMDDKLS